MPRKTKEFSIASPKNRSPSSSSQESPGSGNKSRKSPRKKSAEDRDVLTDEEDEVVPYPASNRMDRKPVVAQHGSREEDDSFDSESEDGWSDTDSGCDSPFSFDHLGNNKKKSIGTSDNSEMKKVLGPPIAINIGNDDDDDVFSEDSPVRTIKPKALPRGMFHGNNDAYDDFDDDDDESDEEDGYGRAALGGGLGAYLSGGSNSSSRKSSNSSRGSSNSNKSRGSAATPTQPPPPPPLSPPTSPLARSSSQEMPPKHPPSRPESPPLDVPTSPISRTISPLALPTSPRASPTSPRALSSPTLSPDRSLSPASRGSIGSFDDRVMIPLPMDHITNSPSSNHGSQTNLYYAHDDDDDDDDDDNDDDDDGDVNNENKNEEGSPPPSVSVPVPVPVVPGVAPPAAAAVAPAVEATSPATAPAAQAVPPAVEAPAEAPATEAPAPAVAPAAATSPEVAPSAEAHAPAVAPVAPAPESVVPPPPPLHNEDPLEVVHHDDQPEVVHHDDPPESPKLTPPRARAVPDKPTATTAAAEAPTSPKNTNRYHDTYDPPESPPAQEQFHDEPTFGEESEGDLHVDLDDSDEHGDDYNDEKFQTNDRRASYIPPGAAMAAAAAGDSSGGGGDVEIPHGDDDQDVEEFVDEEDLAKPPSSPPTNEVSNVTKPDNNSDEMRDLEASETYDHRSQGGMDSLTYQESVKQHRKTVTYLLIGLGCAFVLLAAVAGTVIGVFAFNSDDGATDSSTTGNSSDSVSSQPPVTQPPVVVATQAPTVNSSACITDVFDNLICPNTTTPGLNVTVPLGNTTTYAPDLYVAIAALSDDGGAAILKSGTPQNLAYSSVAAEALPLDQARLIQRYALRTLFYSTGGPTTWVDKTGWEDTLDECLWFSQSSMCSAGTVVNTLEFSANGLTGTLPPELSMLTGLNKLSITGVQGVAGLSGALPSSLGRMSGMSEFLLQYHLLPKLPDGIFSTWSKASGVTIADCGVPGKFPSLPPATNLTILNMAGNLLVGNFPAPTTSKTSLQIFNVGNNKLKGPLPAGLDALTALKFFSVSGNSLTGPIPSQFGNMGASLKKYLDLSRNQFSGKIPPELNKLKKLTRLNLSHNLLTGTVPDLSALQKLKEFAIESNDLTGTISTATCAALTNAEPSADCSTDGVGQVVCSCCTTCCENVVSPQCQR